MIFINVHFKVKSENREIFIRYFKEKLPSIQKERGCVAYTLLENVFIHNQFTLYEKWHSSEDLEFHHHQAYFKDFIVEITGCCEEKPLIDKGEML